MPRPKVPSTRSFSRFWIAMSRTAIVGTPAILHPVLAAVLAQVGPNSVPANSRSRIDVIFGDRVGRAARRQIAGDRRPRPAAVGALEQVRREVAVLVVLERGVDRARVVLRRADARDVGVGRHAGELVDLAPVSRRRPR